MLGVRRTRPGSPQIRCTVGQAPRFGRFASVLFETHFANAEYNAFEGGESVWVLRHEPYRTESQCWNEQPRFERRRRSGLVFHRVTIRKPP